jgi:hypothetical protein
LYEPFAGAFAEVGEEIKCFQQSEYADAYLEVVIDTQHSSTGGSKFKYIPVIGGMAYLYSGGTLSFNWKGDVTYSVYDADDVLLLEESFTLEGRDTMKPKGGYYGMGATYITGAGVQAVMYPDDNAIATLGDEFLETAGHEIARRMRTGPLASYFTERTLQRDGMDPKTYADFITRKERLKSDRAELREKMQKGLLPKVEDEKSSFELGSGGNVMVCGIGINEYDHYPDLKYAARDCKRFVSLMRSRYNLGDDWVMELTDREATAIKVLRFIERNAAKMLSNEDTFILYFSGHGAPEPFQDSDDGDGLKKYLLLSDSEPDALSLTAISLNDIAELLRKLPCKKVIVFIDSCFSGMAGSETLSRLKGIQVSENTYNNFARISGKGRVILAASSENQVSQELDALQAGVFTHWLLRALGDQEEENRKRIDILELFKYVKNNVETQTGGSQTPVFRGSLDSVILF